MLLRSPPRILHATISNASRKSPGKEDSLKSLKERKTKKDREKREFLLNLILVLFNLSFTLCHKYTYVLTEKKKRKKTSTD